MRVLGVGIILFIWLMPANAESVPYWETASLNPELPGYHKSGKSVNYRYFMGARFHVEQKIEVESIGGYFAPISAGTSDPGDIFGAIIALDDQYDMPDSLDLSTPDVVGHTIVDIDWGPVTLESRDYTASLPVTLEPGWYALIFGSDLFGATYGTAAVGPHIEVGTPDYITRRTHHVETYTTIDTPPISYNEHEEEVVMTWPEVLESYNCTDYSFEPGNEFCTYVSGSEWDGTLEWADASTPSLYSWFNGPDNPGHDMRFFINAADVPSANIDVQPNDDNNFVRTDGNFSAKMYVSVEGSAEFDASQVDASTVKFGPAEASPHTIPGNVVDTNDDGIDDMKLMFRIADTGLTCGISDEDVTLTGETNGALIEFEGSDVVTTELCDASSCHP